MTLVVQSSSATIAVLQNFAAQAGLDGVSSIIGLAGAIPFLLGDNIGTTITAVLASITQSRDAKRTALSHCIFNISGFCIFIWFIEPFAKFIQWISPKGPEVEVISRQIANAHTTFNCIMTLIWLPMIWLLVKIVVKILPYKEKNSKQKEVPVFLDPRLISQPAAAMEMVAREILRCSGMVEQMIHRLNHAIERQDLRRVDSILRQAVVVRKLYDNIVSYLSSLFSSGSMTEEQATQTAGMMYILSDIERTDTLCTEATESLQSILEKKHKLSPEAVEDLCRGLQIIEDMYQNVLEVIRTGNGEDARKIVHKKDNVLDLTLKLRKNHMKRVKQGACDAEMTSDFTRILHSFDRIGNSCANIADAALTGVSFESVLK